MSYIEFTAGGSQTELLGESRIFLKKFIQEKPNISTESMKFDNQDHNFLLTVINKFAGGPVGLDNVASAIGETKDTIEDIIEPFLIQNGYIIRTPRGRIATDFAYSHFGIKK